MSDTMSKGRQATRLEIKEKKKKKKKELEKYTWRCLRAVNCELKRRKKEEKKSGTYHDAVKKEREKERKIKDASRKKRNTCGETTIERFLLFFSSRQLSTNERT